ncbi:MAG: hypothetical protein ACI8RD_014151 [Bacillariaceae sp.]|jgi:hypothetical protein
MNVRLQTIKQSSRYSFVSSQNKKHSKQKANINKQNRTKQNKTQSNQSKQQWEIF